MTNELQNQAADLYFARNSDADPATLAEIERDLRIFIAKVERADLTPSIRKALIRTASR